LTISSEPRIGLRAPVGLHQLFAPVWQQVGDRFDNAVGMFMPVELQPETSTGNAEPDFAAGDLAVEAGRDKGRGTGQRPTCPRNRRRERESERLLFVRIRRTSV
jgi:hypothetical protein